MSLPPRWSAGAEPDGTFTVRRCEVRPGFDVSLPWHWEKPTLARAVLDGGELHLLELADLEEVRPLAEPPTRDELAAALASLDGPRRRGAR